jgi:hypothetical protein
MNWDEPLSNQPAAVRDVASTYKIPEREGSTLITPDQFYERLRAQMPTRTSLEIPGYDAALRRHREGGLAASDVLREAGVPGTRYLDKGSRGVPDTGTSNFAMYDPKLVEIVRKLAGVGGLTAGGALALNGGQAQAAQPFNTTLPDPITEQDRFDIATHRMKPPDVPPSQPQDWSIPGVELQGGWSRDTMSGKPQPPNIDLRYRYNLPVGPQSQAEPQGYDLQEVDHDPFTPGVQTSGYERVVGEAPKPYPKDVQDFYDFVQSYPQQIPFTPPQAIPTQSWSFGNNAPDATPTRFSDIAPPLNYYQPLSNTNGVPTYGG